MVAEVAVEVGAAADLRQRRQLDFLVNGAKVVAVAVEHRSGGGPASQVQRRRPRRATDNADENL